MLGLTADGQVSAVGPVSALVCLPAAMSTCPRTLAAGISDVLERALNSTLELAEGNCCRDLHFT